MSFTFGEAIMCTACPPRSFRACRHDLRCYVVLTVDDLQKLVRKINLVYSYVYIVRQYLKHVFFLHRKCLIISKIRSKYMAVKNLHWCVKTENGLFSM